VERSIKQKKSTREKGKKTSLIQFDEIGRKVRSLTNPEEGGRAPTKTHPS